MVFELSINPRVTFFLWLVAKNIDVDSASLSVFVGRHIKAVIVPSFIEL